MMNYSVLMSVYKGEKSENFEVAVKSVLTQTKPTNDFVIVCDGELNEGLDEVLERYAQAYPGVMNIMRLEKKEYWAEALNDGLHACKNEWVARMDSDDISVPDRCEKQLAVLEQNPHLDAISTGVGEFMTNPQQVMSKRILPNKQEEIIKFAKYRSPLNHATVMYRKSAVLAVGGYENFFSFEDYQLWIKMLQNGAIFENIDDILYLARAGDGLYNRRGGMAYFKRMKRFKKWMKDRKYISWVEYIAFLTANGLIALVPNGMRQWFYCHFLRK